MTAWIYVPFGVVCILLVSWGVDKLIAYSSVSFSSSVALLIALFFGLIACEAVLGEKRTRGIVNYVEIPVSSAA